MSTELMGAKFPTLVRMEVSPATGSTTTLQSPYNWVFFTNGSTTAAQTVVLPSNPVDGQMVLVSNASAITAITFSPTVTGAPSGLSAGNGILVAYSVPLAGWFVVQS